MAHPDLAFKLSRKVGVDVDFHRKHAVITCESADGEEIQLNVDYKTLEEIHAKIRRALDTIYGQ